MATQIEICCQRGRDNLPAPSPQFVWQLLDKHIMHKCVSLFD
jgi:hypothetical protein